MINNMEHASTKIKDFFFRTQKRITKLANIALCSLRFCQIKKLRYKQMEMEIFRQ